MLPACPYPSPCCACASRRRCCAPGNGTSGWLRPCVLPALTRQEPPIGLDWRPARPQRMSPATQHSLLIKCASSQGGVCSSLTGAMHAVFNALTGATCVVCASVAGGGQRCSGSVGRRQRAGCSIPRAGTLGAGSGRIPTPGALATVCAGNSSIQ